MMCVCVIKTLRKKQLDTDVTEEEGSQEQKKLLCVMMSISSVHKQLLSHVYSVLVVGLSGCVCKNREIVGATEGAGGYLSPKTYNKNGKKTNGQQDAVNTVICVPLNS